MQNFFLSMDIFIYYVLKWYIIFCLYIVFKESKKIFVRIAIYELEIIENILASNSEYNAGTMPGDLCVCYSCVIIFSQGRKKN